MNSTLAAKKSSFCVANLRNSWLFRAIGALNLNLFAYNLLRPELIRGSLGNDGSAGKQEAHGLVQFIVAELAGIGQGRA